jgi:hypothetical protein
MKRAPLPAARPLPHLKIAVGVAEGEDRAVSDEAVSISGGATVTPRLHGRHRRATAPLCLHVSVHVFEVVQAFGCDPSRRAVGVGRQGERNAIAPPSAHLGGEQLGIDLVLV